MSAPGWDPGPGRGDSPDPNAPNSGLPTSDPMSAMAHAIRAQQDAQTQATRLMETQQAAMRAAALGGMSASQYTAMSAAVMAQQQQQQMAQMVMAQQTMNPAMMQTMMAMMMNPGAAGAGAGHVFANPLLAQAQGTHQMAAALAAAGLAPPPGQLAPTSGSAPAAPAPATAATPVATKEEVKDEPMHDASVSAGDAGEARAPPAPAATTPSAREGRTDPDPTPGDARPPARATARVDAPKPEPDEVSPPDVYLIWSTRARRKRSARAPARGRRRTPVPRLPVPNSSCPVQNHNQNNPFFPII